MRRSLHPADPDVLGRELLELPLQTPGTGALGNRESGVGTDLHRDVGTGAAGAEASLAGGGKTRHAGPAMERRAIWDDAAAVPDGIDIQGT